MIATIAAKELKMLFGSPLAWTILGVLQLVLAWLFLNQVDAFLNVQGQLLQLANPPGVTEMVVAPLFGATAMILLVITPVLAMRLIAEERRNHTLPLLLSAPLSLCAIVLGKFLALWLFLCLLIALAAAMALALIAGGPLDIGLLLVGLGGLVLLAACLAALGLYFSSLTAHPAVAAISGIGCRARLVAARHRGAGNRPAACLVAAAAFRAKQPRPAGYRRCGLFPAVHGDLPGVDRAAPGSGHGCHEKLCASGCADTSRFYCCCSWPPWAWRVT